MVAYSQGYAQVITDLDTFEYNFGEVTGPDPDQRDLDAVLTGVTRVCVLEGAMFQGRSMGGPVLVDVREPEAIRDLADCLRILQDPATFGHCACLGGPTLELYVGRELVATIGLQHGTAIRWKKWHHDAQLRDGGRLTRWLQARGVAPANLEAIYGRGMNHVLMEPDDRSGLQKEALELCSQAQERAQAGKMAEALSLCTRALELDPSLALGYALRGQVRFNLGLYTEAGADCSSAIDLGHRHAQAYFIRSVASDADGRPEDGLADLAMALHFDPEHSGAHNSRGWILVQLRRHDEALESLSEAIRLAPEWPLARLNRARLYHGLSRLDDALADYDRAIELMDSALRSCGADEDSQMMALAYFHRGVARLDSSMEEEAEADFVEAYSHHPETAAEFLGEMWMRRSEPIKALETFAQLVRDRPEDARGYLRRGMVEEALGDLDEAELDYSTAIELQDRGIGYLMRSQLRVRMGRPDDALADISELVRSHPEEPRGYLFRAELLWRQKSYSTAIEDMNSALRAVPDDPHTCNNLAWYLATCPEESLRDGERAVSLARRACEATRWKHPFCMGTLAAALAETGDFAEAARWQAEALDLYPEEEKAAGRARLALYRAGRPHRE